MAEEQSAPATAPQPVTQEQHAQATQSAQDQSDIKTYTAKEIGGGKHEKYVDFDRFNKEVEKSRSYEQKMNELEQKSSAIEQRFEAMRKAFVGDTGEKTDTTEEFNEMLKVGPKAYFERLQAAAFQNLEVKNEVRSNVEKFRSLPDYSPELEESISKFIQDNELQNLGASKALNIAYRAITGKNMGEGENGYNTKKVKESLGRPGSASGKGKENIDLKNMSVEDFKKNEKEIYAKIMAQANRE